VFAALPSLEKDYRDALTAKLQTSKDFIEWDEVVNKDLKTRKLIAEIRARHVDDDMIACLIASVEDIPQVVMLLFVTD